MNLFTSSKPVTVPPIPQKHDLEKLATRETLSAFALGSATTLLILSAHKRFLRRFPTSDWITPDFFGKRRWIKGYVTNVGDADNFRLYHTPGLGWRGIFKGRIPSDPKLLKDKTLHIRVAGADAPEAAHFGRPAQEFSQEALAWLKATVEHKTVYCQLLRRDQYSRLVSHVLLPPRFLPRWTAPWLGTPLSLKMIRAGWGVTYEQAGAEYGKWGKEAFMQAEAEAKAARRGIWKRGKAIETPAEYKRRHAAAAAAPVVKG